jgi:hypothetical protein
MKKILLTLVAAALLAACSAPKYAYHFDHYDYNSGKKKSDVAQIQANPAIEQSPVMLAPETLVASADQTAMVPATDQNVAAKKYASMTKKERSELRREAKNQVKRYIKAVKSGDSIQVTEASNSMDNDLKLAAIFGAVGLVALIIGGDVFWIIGGIALLIGVVFFVKWLLRQ